MDQKINDGGSAFPVIPPNEMYDDRNFNASGYPYPEAGMSLRDWFAGQAIGAVILQCARDTTVSLNGRSPEQYFAEKAFGIADAMLKAGEG